jgi:hypothetical protein
MWPKTAVNLLGHLPVGRCPQFGSSSRVFGVRAGTAAGAATDAVAGASVVVGMLADAVFDTSGGLGADFTSLLVLYVFSDTTVTAAAGAAIDAAAGELLEAKKSDGADLSTGGVGGAASFSLLVCLSFQIQKFQL